LCDFKNLPAGIRQTILFDPPEKENQVQEWLKGNYEYQVQEGSGLGERLRTAFGEAFEQGATRVIAIGTDAPDLNSEKIQTAFLELESQEMVVGPACDGGYYLIGMKRPIFDIFDGIDWSTQQVLRQTLEKLESENLPYSLLEPLHDIDTAQDLDNYPQLLQKVNA